MFAPHPSSHGEIRKGDDVAPTSLEEGRGSHGIAGDIGSDMACTVGVVIGVDMVVWMVCGHWVNSDMVVWRHVVDSDMAVWRHAVVGDDDDVAVWTACGCHG